MAATAPRIHTAPTRTLRGSAEVFPGHRRLPGNTRHAYTIAIVKTVDHVDGRGPDGLPGPSRPVATVGDDDIDNVPEKPRGAPQRSTPGTPAMPPPPQAMRQLASHLGPDGDQRP